MVWAFVMNELKYISIDQNKHYPLYIGTDRCGLLDEGQKNEAIQLNIHRRSRDWKDQLAKVCFQKMKVMNKQEYTKENMCHLLKQVHSQRDI